LRAGTQGAFNVTTHHQPGRPSGGLLLSKEKMMADPTPAEIMYPNQQGNWRIELKYLPIGHRGHARHDLLEEVARISRQVRRSDLR
jgi:hypothetical protein